jgi:hypothetical protein
MVTRFVYALRPTLAADNTGFDSLELLTPVGVDTLRVLTIDGVPIDLAAYPPEITDSRLVLHFPPFGARDTKKLLRVEFDARVFRYGTEFTGRVFHRAKPEEVPQLVTPGDATTEFGGNGVTVRTTLTGSLILALQVAPNPFTPNGDGINDFTTISYDILHLTSLTAISVTVYTYAGRLVRTMASPVGVSGAYAIGWDGRDDTGHLLPPGNYLCQVSVMADEGEEQAVRTVTVVY